MGTILLALKRFMMKVATYLGVQNVHLSLYILMQRFGKKKKSKPYIAQKNKHFNKVLH